MEKLTTLISDFSKNPSCISSDSCGLNQSADALSKVFKQPNFLKQNSDVMQKKKNVVYDKITNFFIEKLENGIIPWRRTWGHYGLAQNYVTKHTYTGINMVVLNMISPFDVPYFLTWNQIEELGGKVKKGSKSLPVIYFKTIFKDENGKKINETRAAEMRKEDKEIQKIPFTKYYNVFNVEQIEGIDFEIPELTCQDNQSLAQCEQLIDSMEEQPVFVSCNVNQPYYSPSKDVINMPDICQFENSEEFYNTTWHELIHWTGHEKRLARSGIIEKVNSKSVSYGEEELIAEIGASFLCAYTGIDRTEVIENNAAYVAGWLKQIKGDNNFVFRAASAAQKAVNYITKSVDETKEIPKEKEKPVKTEFSFSWQGISITATYEPTFNKSFDLLKYQLAHLTIRTENKAVLPVTETGYRSIYESNEVITDAGGAKAYLIAALDEAAKSKKWKNYLKDNSQLSLF